MAYRSGKLGKGRPCLWVALVAGVACSRSGLEVEALSRNTGGGGPVLGTGGNPSRPSPSTASRRWIAVPTEDASNHRQLFAVRLGDSDVEDVVRLDPTDAPIKDAWGEFSRQGRGIAVSVSEAPDEAHAARLWDFDQPKPTSVEVPSPPMGLSNRFGPWLDEHRIVLMQAPQNATNDLAKSCSILDLDHPTQVTEINFASSGASCGGFFAVSPEQKWLAAQARFNDGSQGLLVASLTPEGIGPFTRVAEVPSGQTAATIFFSPNDDYLALENVDLRQGLLSLDIPIVALTDPPAKRATFHVTKSTYLNFVQWAPSGSRYFVHTTRIDASMRGSNPIFIADAETGLSQEVTPLNFFASSPGFTREGGGLITGAYDDELGLHPMQWVSAADLASPPQAGSRIDLRGNASPVRQGFLRNDGSAFYGITGPAFDPTPSTPGPFELHRFDFSPFFSNSSLSVRLSNDAEVRRWLPSPTQSHLVFRVAVTSGVYSSTDPITQSHLTSESGTYLLPLDGSAPVQLAMDWNSFQMLQWLPDTSGLLRLGPANAPSVEMDSTIDDGQVALIDPSMPPSIVWMRFDGGKGVLTDLTPYLGENRHLSTLMVYLAKIWPRRD